MKITNFSGKCFLGDDNLTMNEQKILSPFLAEGQGIQDSSCPAAIETSLRPGPVLTNRRSPRHGSGYWRSGRFGGPSKWGGPRMGEDCLWGGDWETMEPRRVSGVGSLVLDRRPGRRGNVADTIPAEA